MNEKDILLPENTPVVPQTVIKAGIATFDDVFYCSTCRIRLLDSQLMKTAIDYEINADGTTSTVPERYSLFCGTCQKFLGIHDPKAQHELSEMTRTRQENESRPK